MVSPIFFWLLAVVVIVSALAVVLSRNIVHSALYLILSFIGVAGVYMALEADFLAAVQLLVYAGAVAILLVFGVMLTRRGDMNESNPFNGYKLAGGIVAAGLLVVVANMVMRSAWRISAGAAPDSTVGPLAELMLGDFVVPFEVAAILLLVSTVGAIILARGVKQT